MEVIVITIIKIKIYLTKDLSNDDVTGRQISELPTALLRDTDLVERLCYLIVNISDSEDQLHEDRLKSGEVVL